MCNKLIVVVNAVTHSLHIKSAADDPEITVGKETLGRLLAKKHQPNTVCPADARRDS
jgi:hypothetical protein